ncbi:hypothetical protein [Streptomyces sp. NPDC047097]
MTGDVSAQEVEFIHPELRAVSTPTHRLVDNADLVLPPPAPRRSR